MATVIENFDVINKNEHKEIGVRHNNNEKWKNYADRICKNPYVKHYLIEKYGRKCAYCGRPIMKDSYAVIHHIDYDRECITKTSVKPLASVMGI